ncbi:PRC-barrel domain containing protein [Actinokineospora auranticolor]|uniref:PRC-barrel domain protein n=1 Tax=Actinokineospora auranticolor TaxID=155976 RepID=A0A2S6GIS6_9PSEU|nr:hypothetical protein [Actinokineospora auranticolor]PPK65056.1 hypothetical protein CLV40_11699 [Actinokineospora auranticolor]
MRASDLLGRTVHDHDGRPLGRAVDLLTTPGPDGTPVITAVLVAPRHRSRFLGYERPGIQRPWTVNRLARVIHRGVREIPWTEVRWGPDDIEPAAS